VTTAEPAPVSLVDELRRAVWACRRMAVLDADGLSAVHADTDGATRALWAVLLSVPLSVDSFLRGDHDALLGMRAPFYAGAATLLIHLVGSLSLPANAAWTALLFGKQERVPRVVGALLWWQLGSHVVLSIVRGALDACVGAGWVSDLVTVWPEALVEAWITWVCGWILARGLGVPAFVAGTLVFMDLLFSAAFGTWLFGLT
jgi:hypothetical protein